MSKEKSSEKAETAPAQTPKTAIGEVEKKWAMLIHLSAFLCIIPFGNMLIPWFFWALKRKGSPFVDDQGREVVNFNLSLFIYLSLLFFFISSLAIYFDFTNVLTSYAYMGGFILLLWGFFVFKGATKTSKGNRYRYPLTMRFMR